MPGLQEFQQQIHQPVDDKIGGADQWNLVEALANGNLAGHGLEAKKTPETKHGVAAQNCSAKHIQKAG